MGKRFRGRLTFANVVSLLALFVALGGGAYAAAQLGSGAIKDNSIRGLDVRDGSLKGIDVKDESLRGADIVESTLAGVDRCPASAPNRSGDVCFSGEQSASTWDGAIRACAALGLRAPGVGEALLLFRQAPNGETWTDQIGDINPGNSRVLVIKGVADTGPFAAASGSNHAFRCVATPGS
jgi:hypothetical protein